MYQTYSNSKLFDIARDNYRRLTRFCEELDMEGYWDNPKVILNQSIQEVLDRYIQAILICLTVYNGKVTEDEFTFIKTIPYNNFMLISEHNIIDEDIKQQAQKIMNSPPILIQLCGLRDAEKKLSTASSFFEAVLNLLLAMSYLNNENDIFVSVYIQEFYRKVSAFIQMDQSKIKKTKEDKSYYSFDFDKEISSQDHVIFENNNINPFQNNITNDNNNTYNINNKIKIHVPRIEALKKEREALENSIDNVELNDFEQHENHSELNNQKESDNQNGIKKRFEIEKQNEKENHKAIDKQKKLERLNIKQKLQEQILQEQKLKEQIEEENRKRNLEALLEELNDLIGLNNVKTEINSLINLIKVRKLRESYNMPVMDMSYHMVFTGNPGTGKTTVARLISKIYKELGFLTEGNFVETDRAGLVAGFVGQTAIKVKEVVEKAIGGVLFIDEAYSLSSAIGTNDYGVEAIDTLVKLMEDHRDNLIVIVAGYKDEMKEFLKSNTGLVSRFNKFIEFEDYTNDELIDILNRSASKNSMHLNEVAIECIKNDLSNMPVEKKITFGNARGMRNVFENIVVNQANRIVSVENPSIEELQAILLEDVKDVI